ncbi:MAG: protein-(glutamine-N5) methyltransferase, release factor-specific [Acidimicrobiales bacterium mtb01]|nr:peptide chain release factor N(5)-glutamine methyltransferase [Actinomycetota bacterium]TEX46508.1 MAG: protein-(glutamine-N5) methyltransferase, release factor-specific [Acidimicrobiales bacterium mtb01]
MSEHLTWRQLWADTAKVLDDRPAARWLCETACGLDGDEFTAALDEPATERMVKHLDEMVGRYRGGEPLAYAMGRWSFRRVELMVDRRVLIPRPETELVAEVAIEFARRVSPRRVADLGTGSGAIGLALASELPIDNTEIWLTDASTDALDVARANAAGLGRAAANVRFAQGSWWDALSSELRGSFDVVVSNPPYIAVDDVEVAESVREWEPASALFAGDDGLDDVRSIMAGAREWLKPSGWLVIEIGHRQGDAVLALAREHGLVDAEVRSDLAGRPRLLLARLGVLGR